MAGMRPSRGPRPIEERDAFVASPPPRRVPGWIFRAARRQAYATAPFLFAFGFGVIGLILAGVFFPWRAWHDFRLAHAETAAASATIYAAAETRLAINDIRVWRYQFDFQPAPGQRRQQGECFTTGVGWRAPVVATVRYLPDHPEIACLEGARSSPAPAAWAVVAILPLIAFTVVAWCWRTRRRVAVVLRDGRVFEATIVSLESTGVQIDYRPLFRIHLRLRDASPVAPVTLKQHDPDIVRFLEENHGKNLPILVFYHPAHPKHVLLADLF